MSAVPPSPGYFSDNPYQTPNMSGDPNQPRRGMVNQVRVVAILNGVQGALELVMSAIYLAMGGMFTFMRPEMIRQGNQQGDPSAEVMANIMPIVFFVLGGGMILLSILRIIASFRNYYFQNRVLGIVAMCLGLVSSFTCYCAPTSIGIAVYGLIVLFNREVIEAFELRTKGATADQVLTTFQSRPL